MNINPEIHRTGSIELYKEKGVFMAYPAMTPALSMDFKHVIRFKIYRVSYYTNGKCIYYDLTPQFIWFQKLCRARHAFMRYADVRWLVQREQGSGASASPQSYRHLRRVRDLWPRC